MAQHRRSATGGGVRPPRVSRGLLFVILAVLLVIAVVVVWVRLDGHLDAQADKDAKSCVEGPVTIPVVADPDIAPGLEQIAQHYTAGHPVIDDHCVTVSVRPADTKAVFDGIRGRWDPSMGKFPAAWIPMSSVWAAQLAADKPGAIGAGEARPLVTSPVVLAAPTELANKLRGLADWPQIADLQHRDASLTTVGLTGWGSLRMAVPTGPNSDASVLAAQAAATRVMRSTGPLSGSAARDDKVTSVIADLTGGAPRSPAGTPTGAVREMTRAKDPSDAPIHAVPITEQKLYQLSRNGDADRLTEVIPTGPTASADFPILRLTGDQVPTTAPAALAEFIAFVRKPDQLKVLTGMGFRGDAPLPAHTSAVDFPTIADPMARPADDAIVTINRQMYGPALR